MSNIRNQNNAIIFCFLVLGVLQVFMLKSNLLDGVFVISMGIIGIAIFVLNRKLIETGD